jgi:hypothetical protein
LYKYVVGRSFGSGIKYFHNIKIRKTFLCDFFHKYIEVLVSELVGWVRNVILMNVYLDLENPGGSGFWVEGYMSQGREMGKLVYEQPGNEVDGS